MSDFENITDFSAKDSKEYNASIALFEDAGRESSRELKNFRSTLFNESEIPTRLPRKTHNSSRFLDEDYLTKRKMNSDTNATAELLQEQLMFGSTEEDLENEIVDGGVAKEIASVLQQHGITGKAVGQTFKKLDSYYGADPDINMILQDSENEEVEDTSLEDSEEDTSDDENTTLEEKYNKTNRAFRKLLAERNLKKQYLRKRFSSF